MASGHAECRSNRPDTWQLRQAGRHRSKNPCQHGAVHTWQKGGIENANGRLRRWLPRQTNLDDLSDEDLQEIVMTYNLTPRKCLGYITPIQALFKDLGRDVTLRVA